MERCRGTSTSGLEKFIRAPCITKALARKTLLHGYRTSEFRMKEIPIGACGVCTLEVKPEHLASSFKDSMLPPILATPVMIMVMENAALNAIKPYLEPGESALGTRVDIRHLAATPVGACILGEAELTRVDGRRLEFTVRATDATQEIGNGSHERTIVDVARLSKRLDAKRAA